KSAEKAVMPPSSLGLFCAAAYMRPSAVYTASISPHCRRCAHNWTQSGAPTFRLARLPQRWVQALVTLLVRRGLTRFRHEHVQPVALTVERGCVRALLRRHAFDHRQPIAVDNVDNPRIADRYVQTIRRGAEPDRVRFAADGYAGDLAIGEQIQHGDNTCIAR